jgi:hypothetical protein
VLSVVVVGVVVVGVVVVVFSVVVGVVTPYTGIMVFIMLFVGGANKIDTCSSDRISGNRTNSGHSANKLPFKLCSVLFSSYLLLVDVIAPNDLGLFFI